MVTQQKVLSKVVKELQLSRSEKIGRFDQPAGRIQEGAFKASANFCGGLAARRAGKLNDSHGRNAASLRFFCRELDSTNRRSPILTFVASRLRTLPRVASILSVQKINLANGECINSRIICKEAK
jgi:hypothetical protein